jgi:hypothetical protein
MGNEPTLLRVVDEYFRSRYGLSVYDADSLERVMNALYADVGLEREGSFEALYAVIELFRLRIASTAREPSVEDNHPVRRLIGGILDQGVPPEDITIVTFNQDVQIEKALDSLADDRRGIFAIPDSYRLQDPKVISGSGRDGTFDHVRENGAISILKLHGSLNWYRRSSQKHPTESTYLSMSGDLHVGLWRSVTRKIYESQPRFGRKQWYIYPVVVPPVSAKSSIFHRQVANLWPVATDAMSEASSLVVFGYSCPESDYEAQNLIRGSTAVGSPDVTLIDPNPGVVARYHELTGAPHIEYHASIGNYLDRHGW